MDREIHTYETYHIATQGFVKHWQLWRQDLVALLVMFFIICYVIKFWIQGVELKELCNRDRSFLLIALFNPIKGFFWHSWLVG